MHSVVSPGTQGARTSPSTVRHWGSSSRHSLQMSWHSVKTWQKSGTRLTFPKTCCASRYIELIIRHSTNTYGYQGFKKDSIRSRTMDRIHEAPEWRRVFHPCCIYQCRRRAGHIEVSLPECFPRRSLIFPPQIRNRRGELHRKSSKRAAERAEQHNGHVGIACGRYVQVSPCQL
jgi:hypothetical protein